MTKKELEAAFIKLKEENERLRQDNAYLKFELEQMRLKRYKSNKKPPVDGSAVEPAPPRKRGGLFGHIGWFRKKPDKIDRVEEVRISCCPDCGSNNLTECRKIGYLTRSQDNSLSS